MILWLPLVCSFGESDKGIGMTTDVSSPVSRSGRIHELGRKIDSLYASGDNDASVVADMLASAFPCAQDRAEFLLETVTAHRSGEHLDHGSSHIHRNGFSKISLFRNSRVGWNLRLHIWWKPSRDVQIHDHRWDLSSLVLAGRVRAVNYHDGPGDDYAVAHYSDAADGGRKSVEAAGTCALRPVASYTLTASDTHSLVYNEPHLLDTSGSETAATLVLTGPPRRNFSRAFIPCSAEVTETVQPPQMLSRDMAMDEAARLALKLQDFNC
jgi:hypothetical protein